MAGSWTVTVTEPSDAGCGTTPEAPLVVEQADSALRADWGGTRLNGTIYDTFDFSLRSGPLAEPSLGLRGRYVPALADAGEQLNGTLRRELRVDGGTGCFVDVPFTATR